MFPQRPILAQFVIASLLLACNSKPSDQEAFILPNSLAATVEADNARFQALAYTNSQHAETSFGFDIRGNGLLPVRISIDNRSGAMLKIVPRQTFLVDATGQAWPLLASYQVSSRLQKNGFQSKAPPALPSRDELETLTGFAINLVASKSFSSNANAYDQPTLHPIENLNGQSFHNPIIPAGKVASGVLLFPGRDEASSARDLRLCYEQNNQLKFVRLPLSASGFNSTGQ